jgi:hypothetical protein
MLLLEGGMHGISQLQHNPHYCILRQGLHVLVDAER